VRKASWIGGGLHSSAALVDGRVFTWGKAEECGIGLGEKDPPVLQPQEVQGLPRVRALRCGGHHMLASTEGGDLFVWGCGLTHQLANRPRDVSNPTDADEEPTDELRPYQVSSKQLQSRFVIVADGGAQHSVELAFGGLYSTLSQDGAGTGSRVETEMGEPPAKRLRALEVAEMDAALAPEVMREVLRCFSGPMLHEPPAVSFGKTPSPQQLKTLWSPRSSPLQMEVNTPIKEPSSDQEEREEHMMAQMSCLRRSTLEELLLLASRHDERIGKRIVAHHSEIADRPII